MIRIRRMDCSTLQYIYAFTVKWCPLYDRYSALQNVLYTPATAFAAYIFCNFVFTLNIRGSGINVVLLAQSKVQSLVLE